MMCDCSNIVFLTACAFSPWLMQGLLWSIHEFYLFRRIVRQALGLGELTAILHRLIAAKNGDHWIGRVQAFAYVLAACSESKSRWYWTYRLADEAYNLGVRMGWTQGKVYNPNGEYPPKKIVVDEDELDDEITEILAGLRGVVFPQKQPQNVEK